MEITDAMIKKKRKEFLDRVEAALSATGGGLGGQPNPTTQRLQQFAQELKQTK